MTLGDEMSKGAEEMNPTDDFEDDEFESESQSISQKFDDLTEAVYDVRNELESIRADIEDENKYETTLVRIEAIISLVGRYQNITNALLSWLVFFGFLGCILLGVIIWHIW